MSGEFDLTDYVDVGARAWYEAHLKDQSDNIPWEDLPEIVRFSLRQAVLPSVEAVISNYNKNNVNRLHGMDFLEGIA